MKKDKIMFGVLLALVLVLSAGLTVAYFTLSVQGNENAKNIQSQLGTLHITYTDGNQVVGNNVMPNWSQSKTITITNDGTIGATKYYGGIDEITACSELDEETVNLPLVVFVPLVSVGVVPSVV